MTLRHHMAIILFGTALSGCMTVPVSDSGNGVYRPAPVTYAPVAPRIRYVPADYRTGFAPASAYVWIDDADGFAQAIGDAPPDYTFRFDGRDAWAWVSQVGEAMIIERSAEGIVQYYFAPNAAAPYLVRDIYDSYGFDGPDLAVIYDSRGGVVTTEPSLRTLATAERLLDRGRAIRGAALDRRWDRDSASYWSGQSFAGYAFGDSYARGWSGSWQPVWRERRDWQDERARHRDREVRRRLDDEHRARVDHGRRFREWRRRGAPDAPPAMAPVPVPPPVVSPPAATPRPGRPPRTDVVAPVPQPAPVAPPAAGPRPGRPPRNVVDPPAAIGVRPLPEVPVTAEASPQLPPTGIATGVDEENPAAVAPRPPRPGGASRRPDMMPSANRGGPEPATIPPPDAPPLVDQDERDAMAMRRQLLEEERREREAAARAEQEQRDAALRQEMLSRRAEAEAAAAAQAERQRMMAQEMAREAQARQQEQAAAAQARAEAQARAAADAAAARANAAAEAAAARAAADAAARAAAAAAPRDADQPRARPNNVDEQNTQPQ